jgi:ribosomal protein L16/L10AE
MFLQPKSRTFKKDRKNFIKKNYQGKAILAKRYKLSFGAYGLKALASSALKASQIESVRRVLVRYLRKIGHI